MPKQITIDLEGLYVGTGQAKLDDLPGYLAAALQLAGRGNRVVLTGRGPIWLYLALAHELHGVVQSLEYDSPVTGRVIIFDHNPFSGDPSQ